MSSVNFLEKLLDGMAVEWKSLGDEKYFEIANSGRKPVKASLRESGSIPYYGANNIQDYVKGYTHDGNFVLVAEDGSASLENYSIQYASGKFWANNHVHVLRGKDLVNTRFLFHYLSIVKFIPYLTGGVRAKLTKGSLVEIQVPIPCPDNPKKSLEIQAEIVRILDKFTALSSELSTELSWRKKQLKHYYFELFQFSGKTQYLKIKDCCDIKKGKTAIKKATPGEYQLVATTEERQSSSEYQFDCSAVCVPLISSRGHGVASIDRIYFQEGKFALGNILCAIIPNDGNFLSAKFLRHYLFDKKDVTLVPLMRGGANVSLTIDSLKDVEIPIPPIAEQQRIVRILDKFEELVKGLPREIKLREKQYAYYRDLLLSFPQAQAA
ncbi:restriction endonuclease subunit S [Comamonas jiangduensis]|uniref:restriction endonuclease subunit S n=1 Tax=Comamonas jiangduensis TaxID=1194168 RepID=UPI003BF89EA3